MDFFTSEARYSLSEDKLLRQQVEYFPLVSQVFLQMTEKTDFRHDPTQTCLYSHRKWLGSWNFRYEKKRVCTVLEAKTKTLISCAVAAQLICVFDFVFVKKKSIGGTG